MRHQPRESPVIDTPLLSGDYAVYTFFGNHRQLVTHPGSELSEVDSRDVWAVGRIPQLGSYQGMDFVTHDGNVDMLTNRGAQDLDASDSVTLFALCQAEDAAVEGGHEIISLSTSDTAGNPGLDLIGFVGGNIRYGFRAADSGTFFNIPATSPAIVGGNFYSVVAKRNGSVGNLFFRDLTTGIVVSGERTGLDTGATDRQHIAVGGFVQGGVGSLFKYDSTAIFTGFQAGRAWSDGECFAFLDNPYRVFDARRVRLLRAPAVGSAALTGTAIAGGVLESEIVTGGDTIIITLTGDTWAAAGTGPIGSTADTQALIDGFDSAQSEANGWNVEVRDKMVPADDVVRTSDTVCTITIPATAGYVITADETITGTIPAVVLVTSGSDFTATPTFDVTNETVGIVVLRRRVEGI